MSAMQRLVAALRDPASVATLTSGDWSALISVARAEVLLGTLAHRLEGQAMPVAVTAELAAVRAAAGQAQVHALWEAEMCRRALAPLGITPVLLKGTAYAAARLPNAAGRQIGDLDILVPRARLDEVEAALMDAGWEWVKDDPYDQGYYRRWMHELPPLIHKHRDRMIDVHHSILPLTARPQIDAGLLIDRAEALPLPRRFPDNFDLDDPDPGEVDPDADAAAVAGLAVLGPFDMLHHCAAHLFADGDMAGGLRNLWDFHCLVEDMERRTHGKFVKQLREDSWRHRGLLPHVSRALRIAAHLFGTRVAYRIDPITLRDRMYIRRLLARDDWGRETRVVIRLAFYIRSHLLRMPPVMLAGHLWVKWRKGQS